MSKVPEGLKYSREHEWVLVEGNIATVGITDHAQDQLGDIVFVELPEVGDEVYVGGEMGSIESVKSVSEIYSPISGKIVETNADMLDDNPEQVNEETYGNGWLVKIEISDASELNSLMVSEEYKAFVESEG